MSPRPTIRLPTIFPPSPSLPQNRPQPCVMTTPEPWAVGDTFHGGDHSATIAVLSAGVESLTALKDTVEITSVKAVFESVIVILTLVRVRMLVLLPFSRLLIGDAVRTKYTKIRWWNWPKIVSERATCWRERPKEGAT